MMVKIVERRTISPRNIFSDKKESEREREREIHSIKLEDEEENQQVLSRYFDKYIFFS